MHWLGLMHKASFSLLALSLVNPYILPLRNSHSRERFFSKRCMCRWMASQTVSSLGRLTSSTLFYGTVGEGQVLGLAFVLFRQQGRWADTPPHPAWWQVTHLLWDSHAWPKVERKFKNLPSLYQPPVKGRLEIQTFILPGINKHSRPP